MSKKLTAVSDKVLDKLVSRKLSVFVLASIFLVQGYIDGDQWVALSLAYIGLQGTADIAAAWKSGTILGEPK